MSTKNISYFDKLETLYGKLTFGTMLTAWREANASTPTTFAKKLGISVKDLQRYMDAPNKSYKDYKSQAWIYNLGSWVMKSFGLELGGKR